MRSGVNECLSSMKRYEKKCGLATSNRRRTATRNRDIPRARTPAGTGTPADLLFPTSMDILLALHSGHHPSWEFHMPTAICRTLRAFLCTPAVILLVPFLLRAQAAAPQDFERDSQRLVVNADGSLTYIEPFGPARENRLEYHNKPRPTIDLYSHKPDEEQKVTIIDYDGDGRPDFIHIERMNSEAVTDMVGLYRGPKHKIHEEGHLDHALHHRFILGDSASAHDLRERLEAIQARVIPEDEVGVFSGYGLFAELRLPVIRSAFDAADGLAKAVARLTDRSLKQMGHIPEIATDNAELVRLLLSINPHNLAADPESARTAPAAPSHPNNDKH